MAKDQKVDDYIQLSDDPNLKVTPADNKSITVVISGKRGVGKSTVGALLSVALSNAGFSNVKHRTNIRSVDKSHRENITATIRQIVDHSLEKRYLPEAAINIIEAVDDEKPSSAYVELSKSDDGTHGRIQIHNASTHESYAWIEYSPAGLEDLAIKLLKLASEISPSKKMDLN